MNYESMSDFEINKAVSVKLGVGVNSGSCMDYQDINKPSVPISQGSFPNRWVNYCDKVSDAWDIIIENEISINKLKCEPLWIADKGGDYVKNKNPLRAAMIVFLMMQND